MGRLALRRWIVVVGFLLSLAPVSRADDAEREIWHFEKAGVVRELDVTDLPDDVRRRLVEGLEANGFERRPGTGRDLKSDVATLVAHGGHFPHPGAEATTPGGADPAANPAPVEELDQLLGRAAALVGEMDQLLARAAALLDRLEADPEAGRAALARLRGVLASREDEGASPVAVLDALLAARGRGVASNAAPRLFGAPLRPAAEGPGPGGAALVLAVPAGSVAAALGLEAGDAILDLDGRRPTARILAAWARAFPFPGQRRLAIRRRSGVTETWDVRCEAHVADGEAPGVR